MKTSPPSRALLCALLLSLCPAGQADASPHGLTAARQALEAKLDARYDEAFRILSRYMEQNPSDSLRDYYLRLLESFRADRENPSDWIPFLERQAASSELAGLFLNAEYFSRGRTDDCRRLRRELNILTNWLALAPFDNEDGRGHETAGPPETTPFDPLQVFDGKLRPVRWRNLSANPTGRIKPDNFFRPWKEVTGYFIIFLRSDQEQTGWLKLAINTPFKIFLNGSEAADSPDLHPFAPDQHAFRLTLREGWNSLMIKSSQPDQDEWKFLARLEGWPSPVEQTAAPQIVPPSSGPVLLLRTDPVAETLQKTETDTETAFHTAYYSFLIQNTDRSRNDTGRAFEKIAGKNPAPLPLFMAAVTHNTVRGAKRFLNLCLRQGDRAEPLVQMLRHAVGGERDPERTTLLKRIDPKPRRLISFLAQEHLRFGRVSEARRILAERKGEPDADSFFLAGLCDLLSPLCSPPEKNFRSALEADITHEPARERLLEILLRSGRTTEALEIISLARSLFPDSIELLADASEILARTGRTDQALTLLAEAGEICPEDADLLHRTADLTALRNDPGTAEELYRRALEKKPGDRTLRQKLLHLRPATNALFHFDPNPDLSAAFPSEGPTRVLLHREVCEVFPDGTSSILTRRVVLVNAEEDIESLSAEHVFYDPATERVDILKARVYDNPHAYRESDRVTDQPYGGHESHLFYDLRIRSAAFPRVTPGSVIEWQYLVTEQGRNTAALSHFGREFRLRSKHPVDRAEFVVLSASQPAVKTASENIPRSMGLKTERGTARGRRFVRFTATNLPALAEEHLAPSGAERAGSLLAGTLPDWTAFGVWLTDLYKDRLLADESVSREARRLTDGLAADRDKIEAVWAFVSSAIRYTGLELGLGGIQPRKAPDVLASRFGDCKDKAGLMAAMLRSVGIPAHVALVRTAERGFSSFPLAVIGAFDHAVCFAGGKIYDATADFFDAATPPWQDLLNKFFVLDGPSSRFEPAPASSPRDNRIAGQSHLSFEPDGTALLERALIKTGQEAAYFRYEFLAPERRNRRIEESWNASHPGCSIRESSFSNLSPLAKNPAVLYRIRLPGFVKHENDRVWIPSLPSRQEFARLYAPEGGSRTSDTVIPYPLEYSETVYHTLPDGWIPEALPEKKREENRFGLWERTTEFQDGLLSVSFRLVLKTDRVRPEHHAAFRSWLILADRAQNEKIFLQRTSR